MHSPPVIGKSYRFSPHQALTHVLSVLVVLLGVLVAGQTVVTVVKHIRFPYETIWSEGYYLQHALQLWRGENIYVNPAERPVTSLPYGFFYQLLLAPLVRWFGPELWVPRTVSSLTAIWSCVWVFVMASRRANSYVAGALGVLLTLITYFLIPGQDSANVDSPWIAFGLGAILCLERIGPGQNRRRLVLAVLLSCASCCTKQPGAGFVLALGTSLLIRRRALGVAYLVACALAMGSVCVLWHFLSGGHFEKYMVMVLGDPYEPSKLTWLVAYLLTSIPLLLLAGLWQVARDFRRSRCADPIWWSLAWVGLASVTAFLKHGGLTTNLTAIFLLMSVPAGVRLSEMIAGNRRVRLYRPLALVAVVGQLAWAELSVVPRAMAGEILRSDSALKGYRLIEKELSDPRERVLMTDRIAFALKMGRPVYDSAPIIRIGCDEGLPPRGYSGQMASCARNRLKEQIAARFFDKILIP